MDKEQCPKCRRWVVATDLESIDAGPNGGTYWCSKCRKDIDKGTYRLVPKAEATNFEQLAWVTAETKVTAKNGNVHVVPVAYVIVSNGPATKGFPAVLLRLDPFDGIHAKRRIRKALALPAGTKIHIVP